MTVTSPEKTASETPSATEAAFKPLNITEIMDIIPHRYPFLLVDRITDMVPGQRIRGYKNVSMNEPFFQGHFPNDPIMPGVLQLEALAQLGAVLMGSLPEAKGKLIVFAGIDKVRFRQIVVPGDRLDMEVDILKLRLPIGKSTCRAFVNGKLAVEAEIVCSFVDRNAAG